MKDIRQGNDIRISWSIFKKDEQIFSLEGKNTSLYLKSVFGRKELNDFVITGNIIQWTFYGKDQKNTGKYSLEMVINEGEKGMITTDKCDFVNLVSCSCKLQGGEDAPNVETESIELRSVIDAQQVYGIVDSELSETSENPLQNKLITAALKEKQDEIKDLETIRSGAAKGETAIQEVKTINGESIVGSGNIEIQGGSDVTNFTNPVGPHCPDPCFWKADDGYFYIKGTGRIKTVLRTRNFVNYEDTGRTFLSESTLEWLNTNYGNYTENNNLIVPHCWAPFVIKIGSNWVLYMSVVERIKVESEIVDGAAHIVAFTSKTPYGDFTNPITIVSDGDFKLTNSVVWNNVIDPFVYCNPEDQKLYLVAGSSYSIGMLELTDDGLATVLEKGVGNKCVRIGGLTINSDPTREQVYEGAYIYARPNNGQTYYYLFASKGHYAEDNYGLIVGRCNNLNASPGDLNNGWIDIHRTALITKVNDKHALDRVILSGYTKDSGKPWGPGHCAGIFETADGKTWMLYHCHTGNGTNDRQLFIQEVLWDNEGWPYFEGGKVVENGCILNNIITETLKIDTETLKRVDDQLTELSAEVSELSEKVENLPTAESSVFEAIYGETTYNEILEAYNEGKVVFVKNGHFSYYLNRIIADTGAYFFAAYQAVHRSVVCSFNNAWSEGTINMGVSVVDNGDGTLSLTANNQTAEVATPQYVENLLGTIINGDY